MFLISLFLSGDCMKYLKLGVCALSLLLFNAVHPMLIKASKAALKQRVPVMAKSKQKRTYFDAIKPLVIIKQKECMVIERFGKYDRTLRSGIHFKVPFVETPRIAHWLNKHSRIDLRECVRELPKQKVITEDNVEMTIGGLVYYMIEHDKPEKAIYEIEDLPYSVEKLALTTLRNIIGSMHFDKTLTSRDQINKTLCSTLDGATDKWGVTIKRVELQEITPPRDILNAMERQMVAERVRRAVVTEAEGKREAAIKQAEGERESAIKKAEGQKTSAILQAEGAANALIKNAEATKIATILEAEGDAQAKTKRAQAEADAIDFMQQVSGEKATDYMKAIEYIRALPKIAEGKDNKLIILPVEISSLASLVGTAQELLKNNK